MSEAVTEQIETPAVEAAAVAPSFKTKMVLAAIFGLPILLSFGVMLYLMEKGSRMFKVLVEPLLPITPTDWSPMAQYAWGTLGGAVMLLVLIVGVFLCLLLLTRVLQSRFAKLLHWAREIPQKIPVLGAIYGTVVDLVDQAKVVVGENPPGKPCLAEIFEGCFQAGLMMGEVEVPSGDTTVTLCRIYVIAAPSPTSGQVHFVPKERVYFPKDAAFGHICQLNLSCGVACPEEIEAGFLPIAEELLRRKRQESGTDPAD